MKDYQERMIAEFKELSDKRAKLEKFMASVSFKKLSFSEKHDMSHQLCAMKEYEKALFSRLQRVGVFFCGFGYVEVPCEAKDCLVESESPSHQCEEVTDSPAPAAFEGFVDLGLPSGTLWAEENAEGFYTFDDAVAEFGDSLPSARHMIELYECCQWKWDSERKGYEVIGLNGSSIFLPAAGYRYQNSGEVRGAGSEGNYWTRCPDKFSAADGRYLSFGSGIVNPLNGYYRANGFSVRAVRESN